MGFNAKVKCVSGDGIIAFGEIIEIKDGKFRTKSGVLYEGISSLEFLNNVFCNKFELVEEKQFTKADLRTGMRIVRKDGVTRLVMCNVYVDTVVGNQDFILVDFDGENYSISANYDNNLNNLSFSYMDIVKVFEKPEIPSHIVLKNKFGKLLWQRPEPRQITKSEAEKLLSEQLEEQVKIID